LSRKLIDAALRAFEDREIVSGLKAIDEMVVCSRYFDAMKALRALFPQERTTMAGNSKARAPHAA
jgi:flagellar protein FlbT